MLSRGWPNARRIPTDMIFRVRAAVSAGAAAVAAPLRRWLAEWPANRSEKTRATSPRTYLRRVRSLMRAGRHIDARALLTEAGDRFPGHR